MMSSSASGCSSDRRTGVTGGGRTGTGINSAAGALGTGQDGGNRKRDGGTINVKEESEVMVIDLEKPEEDHEAPTQLLDQNQTLPGSRSEVGRGSGSGPGVSPFADCWNSLMEETKRKLMESVEREHEAKTAEILATNKRLEEKNQQLEAIVEELTLKVKEEQNRTEALKQNCNVVFAQMGRITGILGGSASALEKFVSEEEGGGNKGPQQVPDKAPVTNTGNETTLLTDFKMETLDDVEGQSAADHPSAPNNDLGPMTLGQVKEEVDQPTGFSTPSRPPRSLVEVIRQIQLGAQRSRIAKKYLNSSSRVTWSHGTKRAQNQGLPARPAKASRSDRSMYALRPTPAKRRRLNISRRPRPNPNLDLGPRARGPTSQFASRDGEGRLSGQHRIDEARSAIETGNWCTCGTSLSTQTSLKRHIRYFTDDWKFKCEDCGQYFFSTNYMREHMTRYHDKVLPAGSTGCTRCGIIFPSYSEMNYHQKHVKCAEASE